MPTTPANSVATTQPRIVCAMNIRIPKDKHIKYHLMRYDDNLNLDFSKMQTVTLQREDNMKKFGVMNEEPSNFQEGSEYNRDLRENVRRKKLNISLKNYRSEDQPWILNAGGKRFKGKRQGGFGENSALYLFCHEEDGTVEAYPLNGCYDFQPTQRFQSPSVEEVELEFGRRKKVINKLNSLMLRKNMKDDEEKEKDSKENQIKKGGSKQSELKISEMDEWIDTDEDSDLKDSNSDEEETKKNEDNENDKKSKMKKVQQKNKKQDIDVEAFEESDDGDEEGRELDYDTSSSEDEPDSKSKLNKNVKSTAEADALRELLTSDEEEDDEKEDEHKYEVEKSKIYKLKEGLTNEKIKSNNKGNYEKKDSSSDFSSDSTDTETETDDDTDDENNKKKVQYTKSELNNKNYLRSVTPKFSNEAFKRKANGMPTDLSESGNNNYPVKTPAKQSKTDIAPILPSTSAGAVTGITDDYGITEEAVRRYLLRKPITTSELLQKFKNKKTNVSRERLIEILTPILGKINPVVQTIQGKMYISIETE